MRLRHPDGSLLHLAYCSNVHPADDLDGIAAQLERFPARVRAALGVDRLGVGLWVAAPALPGCASACASALDALGLEVVTLNGFPYRAFHAAVVKRDVYRPNWATDARRDYTLGLARLLAQLLPDDVDGGLDLHAAARLAHGVVGEDAAAGRRALEEVADGLAELRDDTGKTDPAGAGARARVHDRDGRAGRGVPRRARARVDRALPRRLPSRGAVRGRGGRALAQLDAAGASVVKAQVSSALRVPAPGSDEGRAFLADFAEPRFLHQTRECVSGAVQGTDDLPEALAGALPARDEWRVHFHVPVHAVRAHDAGRARAPPCARSRGGPAPRTRHYEVETYTWGVLPDGPGGDEGLVEGLAAELAWTRDRLVELGAEEVR